ncbi:putative N-acetylmuramoyl-L-alanine amidase amiA [Flavobacterium limnosediminis JC2902]|uniref:N-acetylmuramoyl-L-alanine amidase n=1 Tax=Flavobacterium limnosediminis JC2902 TaxID=1341181 RepID=V6SUV9_9FLAO|nr:N-acetylmuramoyl-L-alanine amidase [Flavobacterium limnosediminis]ESU28195.1 putative N-acetylmuramoyl-L-alanine amidase amiA [Flavobacterium limnosediminis JC2902]
MKMNVFFKSTLLALVLSTGAGYAQNNAKFRVVLDAGHGGNDFGATYHGYVEKNNALNVALKVGRILESDPGSQVIYTRKTDVFIPLDERAEIANKSKADIFVSIHCNANKNQVASGTETYVMGVTKNASNLEVARKENEVVTLEKDYKIKYDGYDPNSPESVIGMTVIQEEYLDQSIELAAGIQEGFEDGLNRKSRGVKQAGFLVLRKIYMPRVLIEMGFVSNKEEGAFLSSDEGQEQIAQAIAKAILDYKKEYFVPGTEEYVPIERPKTPEREIKVDTPKVKEVKVNGEKGLVFKVQISASTKKLDLVPSNFNGLNTISMEDDGNIIKYFYGNTKDPDESKKLLEEAKAKGYSSAFIVAYKNGQKVPLKEALR